jgi:antitoxin (DNA-binding transcriptional repressor) of toxin-antitoxin stability system
MLAHVSETGLAHNLADYLKRVTERGESFIVVRDSRPVAELRPRPVIVLLGELPGLLASLPELGTTEADRWANDLDVARASLGRLSMTALGHER